MCDLASWRDSQQEADSHGQSLQEATFFEDGNLSRKQEITDSLSGSQIPRTVCAG